MMTHDVMIVLLSLLTAYSDAACEITNCVRCYGNATVSDCILCNEGFWLESGVCKQCPLHCSLCIHSSQCQYCVASYWNLGQLCNSICHVSCWKRGCNDTTGYCYACNPGHYGRSCEEDCSLCINGECDLRKCKDGCSDGYLQYTSSDKYSYCLPCPSHCLKCSNTSYCTQCDEGFYGAYYRYPGSGRGSMKCKQCLEPCTQCTSNEQCPEECNSESTKQGCNVPGGCLSTRSTSGTKTQTTERSPQIPDISTAETSLCPNQCKDSCDARGECHTTTTSNSQLEDHYYEAFGHGIATGIGIIIVAEILAGVVIFFIRRTKCLRTICPTKSTTSSIENQVYADTQEEAGTTPTSRNRPLHTEVNTNSEIHVSLSEEDADISRVYDSLDERQLENPYSDLQIN